MKQHNDWKRSNNLKDIFTFIILMKIIRTKSFPFLYENVFLTAWIDEESGKQKLIAEMIDSETQERLIYDEMECIHTAITTISTDEFDPEENIEQYYQQSSEGIVINLSINEKFKALCSWVAGIAELGTASLSLQSDIKESDYDGIWNIGLLNTNIIPISTFLLKFLIKVEPEFVYTYLDYIKQNCIYEGKRQKSFIISNLIPLMMTLSIIKAKIKQENHISEFVKIPMFDEYTQEIFNFIPPEEIFYHNRSLSQYLSIKDAIFLPYFSNFFLSSDPNINSAVLSNPSLTEHKNYIFLIKNTSRWIDSLLPKAYKDLGIFLQEDLKNLMNHGERLILSDLENEINISLPIINNSLRFALKDTGITYSFPHIWLANTNRISTINLSGLGLKRIPKQVMGLNELEYIFLSHNFFDTIPPLLLQHKNIHHISLGSNFISEIPQPQNNSHLTHLFLNNNHITNISNIQYYPKLKHLSLSSNSISIFSKEILALLNLQNLDLHDNKIVKIPDNISKLVNLQNLDIHDNKIVKIPDNISKLVNLEYLNLANNRINRIPLSFVQFEKLLTLNVENNDDKIEILPEIFNKFQKKKSFFYYYPYKCS